MKHEDIWTQISRQDRAFEIWTEQQKLRDTAAAQLGYRLGYRFGYRFGYAAMAMGIGLIAFNLIRWILQ